jgi:hypothetical protein
MIGGPLIRSLLIQVQKVKVDGALAMSALDKLLQSNELNFGFLALIPTLLVSYATVNYIRRVLGDWQGFGVYQKKESVRYYLRDIERILNQTSRDNLVLGRLICLVHSLADAVRRSPFGPLEKQMFTQDVADLKRFILNMRADGDQGIMIINRIWRTISL